MTIINFIKADGSLEIRQGVARVYNGVAYLTLLVGEPFYLQENNAALGLVDANFVITEIAEAQAEATEEAESDANSG